MNDPNSIEQLEKRIQFITNSLINAQVDLANVKQELAALKGVKTAVPIPAEQKIATPVVKPQEIKPAAVPAPTASQQIPQPKPASHNIEEFIGGKLITIIGIIVLVIGLGIFVKYAIDNDMIGPIGRVFLGVMSGAVLLGIAFKLKEKYEAFSAVLLSGGMATLYFSTFAAYDFYQLIPQWAAFAFMVLFTAFTVFSATIYNRQIIGVLGLAGAYGVPFLLSDNSGRVLILFSYMTLINAGILFLAFKKYWRVLNWVAFTLSWIIFSAWFFDKYDPEKHFAVAAMFSAVFFLMFYLMITAYKLIKQELFGAKDVVMIGLNSFTYFGIGYTIFEKIDDGVYVGLFTLGNALVHFAFATYTFRSKLTDRRFFYLEMGMVLTFLTIAVPVQLNGNWVTMFWSAGALLMFWIGRTQKVIFYERLAYALVFLAGISLMDDWKNYDNESSIMAMRSIANITFFTSLLYIGALAGIWILSSSKKYIYEAVEKSKIVVFAGYAVGGLLLVFSYFALGLEVAHYWQREYFLTAIPLQDYKTYNADLLHFQSVWMMNYSALFLSALTLLVWKRQPQKFWLWTALVLNMIFILSFLTGGLQELYLLRQSFVHAAENVYFPAGYSAIAIRYICYACAALLMVLTHRMLNTHETALAKYFPVMTHFVILIALSRELATWFVLTNPADEIDRQELAHKVGYSILWGVYSLGLIVIGIWKRRKVLRLFAISLFAITLIKLYLFDLRDISTGGKIIVFLALGVLLLIVAFLYQKFKQAIFGDDEK